jgi:hypothetical protein
MKQDNHGFRLSKIFKGQKDTKIHTLHIANESWAICNVWIISGSMFQNLKII